MSLIAGRLRFDITGQEAYCCCILKGAILPCRPSERCIRCIAEETIGTIVLRHLIGIVALVAGGGRIVVLMAGGDGNAVLLSTLIFPTCRIGAIVVIRDGLLQCMMQDMPVRGRNLEQHQSADKDCFGHNVHGGIIGDCFGIVN